MNPLVHSHYQASADPLKEGFEEVLFLSQIDRSYEELKSLDPYLPRGWYELAKLPEDTRVEFVRDFWLKTLPFEPKMHPAIVEIFAGFDDICIFLVKEKGAFRTDMVYSLISNASFFKGRTPCTEDQLEALKRVFEVLPQDYLTFFQIHNGFSRYQDDGLIMAEYMRPFSERFHTHLKDQERVIRRQNVSIDSSLLIPFYERFGMSSFQCFFADWYPRNQMGNVFFSGMDDTISDFTDKDHRVENLAFETFTEWLVFYLEGRESRE